MRKNNSPWLIPLEQERELRELKNNTSTDVVIIGGGIAGITTLFFLLKYTDKKIIVLESHRINHGATGHNAGQIVAEFEKPLSELIKEYGVHKTVSGLQMVEHAWELLDEIMNDTNLKVPLHEFIGYGAYSELAQLIIDLETEHIKSTHALMSFPVLVSKESQWYKTIPEKYHYLISVVDQVVINQNLATEKEGYHALIPQKKGVTNSALFTERLALWCLKQYQERFEIYEYSHVHGIELDTMKPIVITNNAHVLTEEIILCTNGFENFYIHTKNGTDLDTKFHHQVEGAVGYMTGFITEKEIPILANYYYEPGKIRTSDPFDSDPYFYVTQRPYHYQGKHMNLISVGGPEMQLENREIYQRDFNVTHMHRKESIDFMNRHFDMSETEEIFFWHGLMGYTNTGIRLVGKGPNDKRLFYKLGCNGVGILTSIMGSRKIARHIAKEEVTPSIFDPKKSC